MTREDRIERTLAQMCNLVNETLRGRVVELKETSDLSAFAPLYDEVTPLYDEVTRRD